MTYAIGQTILAADPMGFKGSKNVNQAYDDDADATNKLAALIGVGFGSRGYGQTSTAYANVVTGNNVGIIVWNQMFNVMRLINTHTGSGLTIPSDVVSGQTIEALTGTGGDPNVPTLISTLDTNRQNAAVGQMALTSQLSSVRSTTWNTSVEHEFTVAYGSENAARYYFNSGGQLYISASRTGGTGTAINTSITNMLAALGTVRISGQTATYTGSGATLTPIGYYDLTTTYQTIIVQTGSIGYGYTAPTYTLQARTENFVGDNGGNGSRIRFKATIDTNMDPTETVTGTITSAVSQYKATGGALTIATPTYTTITAL